MPEMSKAVIPPHMNDVERREKIVKLGKKITDVFSHKLGTIKVEDPEYWGLAEIVTDEMADVALTMKLRHHYTFKELCKLNKEQAENPEHFQKLLDEMSYIGLLEYDYGDYHDHNGRIKEQGERRYCLPLFVPGSAELFNMEEVFITKDGSVMENPRLESHPALASFFERMTFIPLDGITQMVPEGGAGIGMHVIPVEQAISMENKSMDIEHLSYWLKKYEGHIGVGQCSCRASRAKLEDGCADDQYNWCIGVGDFADYCRETGKGHDITYEEAMAILKNAEDNGFVHQITNIDGENKIFGICNCNVNICNALRTSQLFNTPNLSRSAYTAKVDPLKCVACGKCVEYCPAGAVKLGQKLCKKDGSEVKYPKHELPDNMPWGRDKYDEFYRDNNRINCYETGTAPCKTACPAHVSVQGYLKLAHEGKYTEALALIKQDNPLPAICGRICNKRCEEACTRRGIDESVAIDEVKKFIAEKDLNNETRYVPKKVIASNRFKEWDNKIAIIGAGPAGLSCAYYLALKGYKPTVFEKNAHPGGMLWYGIPSFKLEKNVIDAEVDIIKELGVEFKYNTLVGKDITISELREEGYEAFYIAIGCGIGKLPNIEGIEAIGVETAINFLHQTIDNEKQDIEGDVVVIGGGNVAVDAARTATRLNAKSVTMVCLEDRETMPASLDEIEETLDDGITIINKYGPMKIIKDENNNVSKIVLKKCVRTLDENGKFNPTYDESDIITLDASKVIFAIGQTIDWNNLLDGEDLELNGVYPKADTLTYQTSVKDIFVGGDVYTGPKFAIDAIEMGKCAAESLNRFVHKGASLTIGRNRRDFKMFDKDDLSIVSYDNAKRQIPNVDESIDKHKSFRDYHITLTEEQVKAETKRCLSCGASIVDENKCIGCGVCTTKCMFDAISLVRDHPNASRMVKSEDKFKHILPYAIKRGMKIKFGKHTKEEKESIKKHKEYKREEKRKQKQCMN